MPLSGRSGSVPTNLGAVPAPFRRDDFALPKTGLDESDENFSVQEACSTHHGRQILGWNQPARHQTIGITNLDIREQLGSHPPPFAGAETATAMPG